MRRIVLVIVCLLIALACAVVVPPMIDKYQISNSTYYQP